MGAIGVGELEGRSRDLPRTQSLRLPDLQDLDGVPGVEVVADIAEPEHCSALRIPARGDRFKIPRPRGLDRERGKGLAGCGINGEDSWSAAGVVVQPQDIRMPNRRGHAADLTEPWIREGAHDIVSGERGARSEQAEGHDPR